jgi:hypothetical protein
MKRIALLLVGALVAACASETTTEDGTTGDTGETGQDLSVGVTCTHANMATSTCQQMRATMLAAAKDPARHDVLERGLTWVDANVMYSQTHAYKGFRSDCSGFVSMAWGEGSALTTAGFAPYDNSVSRALSGYSQLLPGDALNKHPREHIFLFGAWADAAHSQMIILEESHSGAPAMMKVVASSYFDSFTPIRSKSLGSTNAGSGGADPGSGGADPGSGSGSGAGSGSGSGAGSGGGDACNGDGDCNPGNDGSGMICVSHVCKPGCHTNAQCPGSETCHSGTCR